MVGKSPKDRLVGPLPNGRTLWLVNGGPHPNHLLTGPGMILQAANKTRGSGNHLRHALNSGLGIIEKNAQIYGIILPSFIDFKGITICQYKDPYKPTSMKGWQWQP